MSKMIRLVSLNDSEVVFAVKMSTCRSCNLPMLVWNSPLSYDVKQALEEAGVRLEERSHDGLCTQCNKEGNFQQACSVCGDKYSFPRQFVFRLTHYPEFPEGETEYMYVCRTCIDQKPQEVIQYMSTAGEIDSIEEGRDYRGRYGG